MASSNSAIASEVRGPLTQAETAASGCQPVRLRMATPRSRTSIVRPSRLPQDQRHDNHQPRSVMPPIATAETASAIAEAMASTSAQSCQGGNA